MFLFSGFDMFLVTVITPKPDGILVANAVYAPMTFAAVLGILLFTMFLGEKKEEAEINDELKQTIDDNTMKISDNTDIIDLNTDKIIEISEELKEYKEKVDRLEQEMKEIRNE